MRRTCGAYAFLGAYTITTYYLVGAARVNMFELLEQGEDQLIANLNG
jgi:hypothetical protein